MAALQVITTESVPARRKIRFWNEAVADAVGSRSEADPLDARHFDCTLRRVDLECFRLVEITGGASLIHSLPSRDRRAPYVFQLSLSGGEVRCWSNGTLQTIVPGDLRFYDVSAGAELELPCPAKLLSFCVPREEVLRRISCPELVASRILSGEGASAALVSRYLLDLWNTVQQGMAPESAVRFARIAVDLLASAYADSPQKCPGEGVRVISLRVRIQSYIEENLANPDLTPSLVARTHGITRSYLHRIFREESESVGQYILRRRLAECRRVLADPLRCDRSVSSVALDHGFNSLSHFSHAFRARYGESPREVQSGGRRNRH